MTKDPEDTSLSTNVLKTVQALNLAGWVGFWSQTILAIISTLILLFAIITRNAGNSGSANPGTGAGTLLAFLGLVAVYLSMFWSYRYTLMAKKLRTTSDSRPSRADTIKQLKIGLLISFMGMFVTLLGAQTIVGVLVAKSLSQPQSAIVNIDFNRLIQPIDIFIVQANTNTILAHFLGLVSSVWLLDRISK